MSLCASQFGLGLTLIFTSCSYTEAVHDAGAVAFLLTPESFLSLCLWYMPNEALHFGTNLFLLTREMLGAKVMAESIHSHFVWYPS